MTKIRIGDEIGQGGFCIVHEAVALDGEGKPGNSELAIKRLQANAKGDAEIRHRFEREARLLDDILDHPNIVSVVYRNLSGDDPFFVMPRADESVADALPQFAGNGPWVRDVYRQVLDGMAYAHGKGVIHRDLKPENLLLEAGDVKLTDFGLGKDLAKGTAGLTRTSMWFGTEPYMAPEQFTAAHDVGPEADVFSLGKLLMVMLSGDVPEVGVPDALDIPEQFRYFISRCCEKKLAGPHLPVHPL